MSAWIAVEVEVARGEVDLVSGLLLAAGSVGLEEREPVGEERPLRQLWDTGPEAAPSARVVLRAWFDDPDRGAVERALAHRLTRWLPRDDTDWSEAWKGEHCALQVGELVIAPPWDAPDGAIVIEPGQGFGTGDHPTTRGVLLALQAMAQPGWSALDVGCGSGVLALAAAKLGLTARGIDVDPEAVREAIANATRNSLGASFTVRGAEDEHEPADLVLANLHVSFLLPLAERLLALTRRVLILGGIPPEREAEARAAFGPAGDKAVREETEGWITLRLGRG